MKTKQCTWCGVTKSVSQFYRRTRSLDGLQHACRECKVEYNRHWVRAREERKES